MSGAVRMRHPQLPPEQEIEVPASSVPFHRAAGWEVVDDPAAPRPAETPDSEAAPAAEAEAAASPKRKRRAPKESE